MEKLIGHPGIILVIGGASEIGGAICKLYHSLGATLVIADQDMKAAHAVARACEGEAPKPELIELNMASAAHIRNLPGIIKRRFGYLDHVVNLQGEPQPQEHRWPSDVEEETVRLSIERNLTSNILLANQLYSLLCAGAGTNRSMTFLASLHGLRALNPGAYSATRAGLHGYLIASTRAFGSHGIRVNSLMPGVLNVRLPTPLVRSMSALGRCTKLDEVARAMLCVSHILTSMTGQMLIVDAGQTVTMPFEMY